MMQRTQTDSVRAGDRLPGAGKLDAGLVRPLVLAIDDDEDARCVWAECLGLHGYRFVGAATGEDGIRAARRERPSVILMDLTMPGMGGLEATRHLKADARTRESVVIIVTSQDPSVFPQVRAAGCDAYFCKPFDAFTLSSILRVLTGQTQIATRKSATKRCVCGRSYARDQWLGLRLWGAMHIPNSGETIEVRDCPCGSPVLMPAEEIWIDIPMEEADR
ncbi:MAG TPA: response regulator [Polyangiaceae bacterium]|jgi:CheY-like chemotaxis protein|nr:response regulator [Polyangiaceae bacterium]